MFMGKPGEGKTRRPHDQYEPIPLQLPIPMPLAPRPFEKEEKKDPERGVWIIEI